MLDVLGMDEKEAAPIIDKAFSEISGYENALSRTVEGSDVDRINQAADKDVRVGEDTLELIREGMDAGKISDGSFDITIGRLTALWDFNGEDPKVPDDEEIQEARKTADYSRIKIQGDRVRLENAEADLDLGGIAKGYIADRVTESLESSGVKSGIVNLGGNVEVIGSKDGGQPFVIGIERPYSDRTEIIGTVEAMDQTVVTSGIYERKFEEDGKLYHHILDPETGYPVETDLESVTLIADKGNSCFCDHVATTCIIKGKKEAEKFIKKLQEEYPEKNIHAVFVNSDDEITVTDGAPFKK